MADRENNNQRIQELQRVVDYQVEERRHIERQASLLFRLIIGAFSLTITAISLLISAIGFENIDWPFTETSYSGIQSAILAVAPIGEHRANLILVILATGTYLLILFTLYQLFWVVPRNAFSILSPPELISSGEQIRSDSSISTSESIVSRYERVSQENREKLEVVRERWNTAHNGLANGIQALGATVAIIIPVFVYGRGDLAVAFTLAMVLAGLYGLPKIISEQDIQEIFVFEPSIDFRMVAAAVSYMLIPSSFVSTAFLPYSEEIFSLTVLIGAILIIRNRENLTIERLWALARRNITIMILIFILYMVIYIGFPDIAIQQNPVIMHALLAVFSTVFWTIIFLVSLGVLLSWENKTVLD